VFKQFQRALTEDDSSLLPHHQKQAEDARSIFPLPIDMEIGKQLPASTNGRLGDLLMLHQETQCALLGIPRTYLLSARSTTSSRASAAQNNIIVNGASPMNVQPPLTPHRYNGNVETHTGAAADGSLSRNIRQRRRNGDCSFFNSEA